MEELALLNESKNLIYTKKKFYTNRSFDNLIGQNCKKISNKLKFFCNNKEYYDKKGLPYHLGILLSGTPGSGKTSVIKSIANYTKRHIINVNLKNLKTNIQLKNINLISNQMGYPNEDDINMNGSAVFEIPI
jgi:AAA+ superfamily predicted ATPase